MILKALKCFVFLIPMFAIACASYSYQLLGMLDTSVLNEVSGMQLSRQIKDRFYFINDSGDSNRLYYSHGPTGKVNAIELNGKPFIDTEDLAILPNACKGSDCIVIGDIGNNDFDRKQFNLYFIQEKKSFGIGENIYHTLKIKYPGNRTYNAEAIAIEPRSKDLYLITKKYQVNDREGIAALFKLDYKAFFSNDEQVLEFVDEIDFRDILDDSKKKERVTSFDFSIDNKIGILTNKQILLADYKLNKDNVIVLEKLFSAKAPRLKKQESFSFSARSSRKFFYTTESKKSDAPFYAGLRD